MPLTPQQEGEIYPILDKALELPLNKGVLHKCTVKRADYLTRMIQGMRYDSAIESIMTYKSDHALYGLGLYSCLWVEPHEQGLLATNLAEPPENLMWQMIQCAAWQQPVTLAPDITYNRARQRLARAQKKYPDIMNAVYITEGDPPTAMYGVVTPEEILVVDIDKKPETRLNAPSDRDVAKAKHPMQNPPKWT
ncbi:MAG: hypothetical protein GY814_02950 [Gammaproteobacteria bacterium]|nr:hypothetical protein [Gammaproteobacteria bacterium]